MRRHLHLVPPEGGNLVEPQSEPGPSMVLVDEALIDLAVNVLDLLLASRQTGKL
jgi:hypothetical protein